MKIKYVDGFGVRRTTMPDFHYTGKLGEYGCNFIPKGELWVENEYRDEIRDILKYNRLYARLMKKKSFQEARAFVNRHNLKKDDVVIKIRSFNNDNIRLRNATVDAKKWIRQQKRSTSAVKILGLEGFKRINVYFVRGKTLRYSVDSLFVFGGHHYVYSYIPKNEIWLDAKQDKREYKYTFFHELYEYQLMRKGMDYDSAHDFAIAFEKYLKRKDGVANYRFDAEENRSKNKVKKKDK